MCYFKFIDFLVWICLQKAVHRKFLEASDQRKCPLKTGTITQKINAKFATELKTFLWALLKEIKI